ncbi:MAG: hypothetical protein AYK18_17155 [Theionarchaea archaeon DG-70]|nr:MAG: hypothetical protein AYK18_17155 [Theionarchaea archaeon DG-70]
MNQMICSAIRSRNAIHFYYNGGFRTAEPFCHGASKNGIELLRAYQVEGHSESGNPAGWKLFRVEKIQHLTVTDNHFKGTRPLYNPDDSAMKVIYCRV